MLAPAFLRHILYSAQQKAFLYLLAQLWLLIPHPHLESMAQSQSMSLPRCRSSSQTSTQLWRFLCTANQEPQLHSARPSLRWKFCRSWRSVDICPELCVYWQARTIQAESIIMAQWHLRNPKALPSHFYTAKPRSPYRLGAVTTWRIRCYYNRQQEIRARRCVVSQQKEKEYRKIKGEDTTK